MAVEGLDRRSPLADHGFRLTKVVATGGAGDISVIEGVPA
jgi:hypothetical protein